jgi:hypothetical protein
VLACPAKSQVTLAVSEPLHLDLNVFFYGGFVIYCIVQIHNYLYVLLFGNFKRHLLFQSLYYSLKNKDVF